MKKKLLLLLPAISLASIAWSQNLDQHVISPVGGINNTDKYSLEWTMGEPAVKTVEYSNGINTEGFHQSSLRVLGIQNTNPNSSFNIVVSPNPVMSVLNIKIKSDENSKVMISLTDLNGKGLSATIANSENDSKDLDLSDFASGLYLLHIKNSSGTIVQTYKISKIN